MKYLSYEGLQYLYSKILTRLGLKVDAAGGNISETVIETLDTVEDKYPVPAAGESVKRFFGKTLTFLRNIRPLTQDITLYVSTTGSDATGNGTSGNPFRNIQFAIDTLPKDLNGCNAIVTVLAGTYNEDVLIRSFHGGTLRLESDTKNTIAGTCYVSSIVVASCGAGYLFVNGFNVTTTTKPAIQVLGSFNVHINYCQSTVAAPSKDGIDVFESYCSLNNCKIANRYVAASFSNSKGTSANWSTGSTGNVIGLAYTNGANVHMIGSQPIGYPLIFQGNGGTFTYENGTQISDDITAGLSCTWGTIRSGYVRHGNINGTAMISINCRIDLTANLTANMPYTITGFPIPAISAFGTASVAVDSIAKTTLCSLERTGVITFVPSVNVTAGSWSFTFSLTYKTNS